MDRGFRFEESCKKMHTTGLTVFPFALTPADSDCRSLIRGDPDHIIQPRPPDKLGFRIEAEFTNLSLSNVSRKLERDPPLHQRMSMNMALFIFTATGAPSHTPPTRVNALSPDLPDRSVSTPVPGPQLIAVFPGS